MSTVAQFKKRNNKTKLLLVERQQRFLDNMYINGNQVGGFSVGPLMKNEAVRAMLSRGAILPNWKHWPGEHLQDPSLPPPTWHLAAHQTLW